MQPVPDASAWNTDPFVGTVIDTRLYGRGSADDGGGIAIHSGALQALGDDLKVNIKVFVEGEEEMGSPSFIPFIEEHKDEFDSDVIIVADSGNWSAEIPSLTTSLRGNTDIDVHVKALHHPVHSGQYGGPILDANTLAAMLIASMYDEHGDLAVPASPQKIQSADCSETWTRQPCVRTPASSIPTVWPAPVLWPHACGPNQA